MSTQILDFINKILLITISKQFFKGFYTLKIIINK